MPTWLVTGGSGFLGRHLLSRLATSGVDVVAIGRRRPPVASALSVDLDDPAAVHRAVARIAPEVVFHLAGRTPPAAPEDFYRSNTMGTVHLLDALRASGRPCRVVLVGSASELGPVPLEALPVGEGYPARPETDYGRSKLAATEAALAAPPPIEPIVARVFNPIGPGMPPSQAFGRFAAALAEGDGPLILPVGDLAPRRDFVDARDVAEALLSLGDRGRAGQVYHVGTGRSHRVGDGLGRLIELSGREVVVEVDPAIAGNRGPVDSRADVRRILEETGWSAVIPWEQSLCDLWAEARGRPGRG